MSITSSLDLNRVRSDLADVRKAQLESASRIVVSQERIASQIDTSLDQINTTLLEMGSMLDWRLAMIGWQLEQQNTYLREILETLQAPLDTKAKELRRRAEEAFRNEWYKEALKDFLASEETNPYDFAVCHSIGLIYMENGELERAMEYFQKAVRYAEPYSTLHASYSQLFVARIHRLQGDLNSGLRATEHALTLDPEFPEANYQHAVSLALVGRPEEARDRLLMAIVKDRYYALKVRTDPEMFSLRSYLPALEEGLRVGALKVATEALDRAEKAVKLAKGSAEPHRFVAQAKGFYRNDSYFDYLDAGQKAEEAIQRSFDYIKSKFDSVRAERASLPLAVIVGFIAAGLSLALAGQLSEGGLSGMWVSFFLGVTALISIPILAVLGLVAIYDSVRRKSWSSALEKIKKLR